MDVEGNKVNINKEKLSTDRRGSNTLHNVTAHLRTYRPPTSYKTQALIKQKLYVLYFDLDPFGLDWSSSPLSKFIFQVMFNWKIRGLK